MIAIRVFSFLKQNIKREISPYVQNELAKCLHNAIKWYIIELLKEYYVTEKTQKWQERQMYLQG